METTTLNRSGGFLELDTKRPSPSFGLWLKPVGRRGRGDTPAVFSDSASEAEKLYAQMINPNIDLFDLLNGHGQLPATSYPRGNALPDFRGIGGEKLTSQPDFHISYSLGRMVEVWRVAVKAKGSREL
ncbi:hypothetical protein BGX26_008673 [Mortierella sp. AD094]|nr:hypothetical protein BGX26_008673 [Mortierella sp. AD094]